MERIQEIAKKGERECKCWSGSERAPHKECIQKNKTLSYAWVIEPHKKGWPHVHIAWDATYVCFDRVRELWWEVTGISNSGSWVVRVGSSERIPHYLAKYLSKGTFSTRLLSFLSRKRIWTTNVRKKSYFESGYELVEIQTGKRSEESLKIEQPPIVSNSRFLTSESHHWTFVDGVNGKYNRWCISGEIADIAYAGAREESLQRSENRDQLELDRVRRLIRIRTAFEPIDDESVAGYYLDIKATAMKRWQRRIMKDEREREPIRLDKGEHSGSRVDGDARIRDRCRASARGVEAPLKV
jgi:hypothetical protein